MRLIAGLLALALGLAPAFAEETRSSAAGTDKPAAKKARKSPPGAKPKPAPATVPTQPEPNEPGDCAGWERKLRINPAALPRIHVGLKTYAETLKLADREVVLTFDDGPWPETTPIILDALRNACVHATFFLIGKRTRKAPELARREQREGHTVGHHSDTHPPFTLRGFDTTSAIADISNGVESDERTIYGEERFSPNSPHVPFFRFPGFADTPDLLKYLDKRHYAVFGTDLWAADWVRMSPDHERERVLRLLDEAPHHNGIILFHDNIRSTAEMLPGLLFELRRRGYRIVHLVYDGKAGPPALTPPVEGWRQDGSETERIIRRLRRPIVPGAHHAGQPATDTSPPPAGETEMGPP